ncbi:cytochrome b/b6 domain-containing protein [Microvirga sp. 2MCAF38]|uniref:cytochrome b/b6 domain-containing protein n=1 Tax=Microvirga sp. 2MCAF38 TaxID=3232989 RepID=UPI003F9B9D32
MEEQDQVPAPTEDSFVYRHAVTVRVTHWINVICITFLLLSGLQIFNAHPRLYWGKYGADHDHAALSIETLENGNSISGVTRVGSLVIPTTGFLGASEVRGELYPRAFPAWLTIPSYQDLAGGRRWHFFFAWLFVTNGLLYMLYGIGAGHFRRDLKPNRDQLTAHHLVLEIADHARLRFPRGQEARRYNSLQKMTYLVVLFVLLPLMVATGLTMSPGVNAAFPLMLDLFGGRQSARTIHFITASLIVTFVAVHIAMVLVSGVWNNMRSMITGYYAIKPERPPS